VNASGHPFWIQTVSGAYSSGNVYSGGVTNGGAAVGTIVWEVPFDAPDTLYYVCQIHSSMAGSITVSNLGPTGPTGAVGAIGATGATVVSRTNVLINSDFSIWQRGAGAVSSGYSADRWLFDASGATMTAQRGEFAPDELEVDVYGDAWYFMEWDITTGNVGCSLEQRLEGVRGMAGQPVAASFWAKAASGINLDVSLNQNFGSGGSSSVSTSLGSVTLTTSWQRFAVTGTVPSLAGKTIGSSNYMALQIVEPDGDTDTISIWGAQLEHGTAATEFKSEGGGAENADLALCQRYYYRVQPDVIDTVMGVGFNSTTLIADIAIPFPVQMRVAPTALEQSGTAGHYQVFHATTATVCSAVPSFSSRSTRNIGIVNFTVAAGLTAGAGSMGSSANVAAYLAWDAEL
jgi:hypothetical protein